MYLLLHVSSSPSAMNATIYRVQRPCLVQKPSFIQPPHLIRELRLVSSCWLVLNLRVVLSRCPFLFLTLLHPRHFFISDAFLNPMSFRPPRTLRFLRTGCLPRIFGPPRTFRPPRLLSRLRTLRPRWTLCIPMLSIS